jgi:sugar phosphate isomerase/epimerase
MPRPITLFTGQFADLPFEEMCRLASEWGHDGLEIACCGDHFEAYGSRPANEEDLYERFSRLVNILLDDPLMFGYCSDPADRHLPRTQRHLPVRPQPEARCSAAAGGAEPRCGL